jgi:murein DD-endopeptidase MepM/ murein hydrolase activator NlpD
MRRNHFHGGLDFRTGGQVNWPIYSLKDGYISHISISSRSYGEMAIIVHPDGHSTLYAHLNCFVDSIEAIVRKHQYEQ